MKCISCGKGETDVKFAPRDVKYKRKDGTVKVYRYKRKECNSCRWIKYKRNDVNIDIEPELTIKQKIDKYFKDKE